MSEQCVTLVRSTIGVPENNRSLADIGQGFCHLWSVCGLVMAGIKVAEGDTIADIDEALSYLVETLKTCLNPDAFLEIVDALLDERLEKS